MASQFHLALPCVNINKTRVFYTDIIGAQIGRSSPKWIDVNLYNHQITFTECGPFKFDCKSYSFNGDILPSFHFAQLLQKCRNRAFPVWHPHPRQKRSNYRLPN